MLSKPRAVLFDWDNTLVDTWPVIQEALAQTFEAYGMTPWTLEEMKERVSRSIRDAFPDLFGTGWEKAGDLYRQNYCALHLERLRALDGAEAVLPQLAEADTFARRGQQQDGKRFAQRGALPRLAGLLQRADRLRRRRP